MTTKVLMTILFASLMILSSPPSLLCQISTIPDSVVIVKSGDGTIGYLIPRYVAVEYLKLRKELMPRAFTMIDSLSLVVLKQDTVVKVLEDQNKVLQTIVNNDSLAISNLSTTLSNTEQTLQKQKRKIRLWKLGAMGTGLLGTVLGFMLGSAGS